MASSRVRPSRKAAEAAREIEHDSNCIEVSSQPLWQSTHTNGTAPADAARPPLAHTNPAQAQNKAWLTSTREYHTPDLSRRRAEKESGTDKSNIFGPPCTRQHAPPSQKPSKQSSMLQIVERKRTDTTEGESTPTTGAIDLFGSEKPQSLSGHTRPERRAADRQSFLFGHAIPQAQAADRHPSLFRDARPRKGVSSQGSTAKTGVSGQGATLKANAVSAFVDRAAVGLPEPATRVSIFPDTEPATKRPRRSTARLSYGKEQLADLSSEDELARSKTIATRRKTARSKAKVVESDFEADAVSSMDDVSMGDGDVAMGEQDTVEEEVKVAAKPLKASAARSKAAANKRSSTVRTKASGKESLEDIRRLLTRPPGPSKGLDPALPPLHEIDDIFCDITQRALVLGLDKALEHLRSRPLRVATMCSGTESPLLALQMVHDALKHLCLDTINIQHIFSAEIVPSKQAYIERNFAPPIIFRDITEFDRAFDSDDPTATTAYGLSVPVPTGVDILVAGTSCVDYSKLNNSKKDISEGGESGKTWEGALAYCKACRPAIIIFENVLGAAWSRMIEHYREIGYDCKVVLVDTKDYYIPHTRQRGYMVCFDKRRANSTVTDMGVRWQALMKEFQRYASSPVSSFLIPRDQIISRQQIRDDEAGREIDWSQCEIRHMQYRQSEKLGNARPFTQWQESGTMVPPENGSTLWYTKQVERVLDTIDCSILRKSLPKAGMYDARFKTRIWDVSQNVDRLTDHSAFGIVGCITPTGMPFVSGAGRAMAPEESLKLQGIPLDKISFTTETPKELQNLAGNAMSSTVVGSALLAALIVGYELIDLKEVQSATVSKRNKQSTPMESRDLADVEDHIHDSSDTNLDVAKMIRDAQKAGMRCYCEGSHGICEKPLQRCLDCGHTTCTSCGGNPLHNYRQDQLLSKDRLSPSAFAQQLKSQLPLRISFSGVGDFAALALSGKDKASQLYLEAVQRAVTGVFSYSGLRRTHCWTASYVAQDARLDLTIEGSYAEWRLFARAANSLACDDNLRANLERSIAKASITISLFDVEWLWRVPHQHKDLARVIAAGSPALTWWARNGIPKYGAHTQPDRLLVEITGQEATLPGEAISGSYRYLPRCGKACDSLYQRVTKSDNERPVFLFLDPSRTGKPEEDTFVFSYNKSLLDYNEVRSIIARLKAPWRPWAEEPNSAKSADADIVFDALWEKAPFAIALRAHKPRLETRCVAQQPTLASGSSCNSALLFASCKADFCNTDEMHLGQGKPNLAKDTKFLVDNAWAFEAMRRRGDVRMTTGSKLIASTATVIVCPTTLMKQWIAEIEDKLNRPKGVLTVHTTAHLSRYIMADFENATIILVSRAVLGSEPYAERLAAFAAIPGPATSSRRSFAQWLQFAKSRVPENMQILKEASVNGLRAHVKAKYQEVVQSEDFKAAVPSKRLKGKDYVAGKSKKTNEIDKLLFEMFYFLRVIIDEFHQLSAKEYAAITELRANKRWALSATLDIGDFHDLSRMAPLLGVPLRIGSDARGVMKMKNVKELRKDMTPFERFDAMRQTPSNSMHARIYEIDQLFLDTFVRRNVIDFAKLEYKDNLVLVTLDLDHCAIYTELSQHLISSDMRIKRGKNSDITDRQERMHAAITMSETAEEALSRSAAFFERDIDAYADSGAGLAAAISVRKKESWDLIQELSGAIIKARDATIADVKRLINLTSIGKTKMSPPTKATAKRSLSEMEDDDEAEDVVVSSKAGGKNALTSAVNGLSDHFVTSKRSLRYLQNIQRLQQKSQKPVQCRGHCDSTSCRNDSPADYQDYDVAVSAFCGHTISKDCYRHLREKQHGEQCPATGCNIAMLPYHLLWTSKMGALSRTHHSPYGAKIEAAMDILEGIRKTRDQAILFVQFAKQVFKVEKALQDRRIPAIVVKDLGTAGVKIEEFRSS
ncbi:hypothetical protein LTR85_007859 [Meristemomyces frigidus]|nr:hypothetical protein LTR85_007859 [Meristemomyces frigidus]